MKKRIICGICLFFALMSALVYSPLITAAISGHGGSTQVIARIEQSSDDQSEEPSAESSEPDTSEDGASVTDESPVATGDAFKWFLSAAAVFSVALIIVIGIDRKDRKDSKDPADKI